MEEDFGLIVDEEDFGRKNLDRFIKKIVGFVKVGKDGKVFVELDSISQGDKIGLMVISRFLAHKKLKSIPEEVTISEMESSLLMPYKVLTARISELAKNRLIKKIKGGVYIAIPYQMEKFIDKICKKYGSLK